MDIPNLDVCCHNRSISIYIYGALLSYIMKKIIFLFFIFKSFWVEAQCAMCKATAESNASNGGTLADGLNEGILYLMAFPYLILGAIAFAWWRHEKK